MFWGELFWLNAAALALAIVLDVFLGEPPAALHPVVYMGKALAWLERHGPRSGRVAQFGYGLGLALLLPASCAVAGYLLLGAVQRINPMAYIVVAGFLLKTCFSVRDLGRAGLAVKVALDADKLEEARAALKALVSRDTSQLTASQAASAAVESVAENTTDSFVAPWLAFALFGVPGALAYRTVNTMDAMIGYHGKYEYLGKASARLDDALNFVPARLAALAVVAATPLRRLDIRQAFGVMVRDGNSTESPNAGLTMAAMAGALGVTLEKVGHYQLGVGLRRPAAADIAESVRVMWGVAVLTSCVALIILAVRYALV